LPVRLSMTVNVSGMQYNLLKLAWEGKRHGDWRAVKPTS